MNERIRQLAEQALQLVADEHTNGDESRLNTDSYHVKDLIQEKFAELIVKECAAKIERDYKYERGEDTKWIIAFAIANDLKAHFGVEE